MSSVIHFEQPIFAEHKDTGLPIAIIAMNWEGSSCLLLYADDAGYLGVDAPDKIRTDWRYDSEEEEWYDAVVRAKADLADAGGGSQGG